MADDIEATETETETAPPAAPLCRWDLIASAALTAVLLVVAVAVSIERSRPEPASRPAPYCHDGLPIAVERYDDDTDLHQVREVLDDIDGIRHLTYIDGRQSMAEQRAEFAGRRCRTTWWTTSGS